MTNLTEQYRKGELELNKCYYITTIFSPTVYIEKITMNKKTNTDFNDTLAEVLAEVPSYEKWQELKEFADYSIHNREELTRQINFWVDENSKLKELLKECKYNLKNGFLQPIDEFIAKIDQVLGE